MDGLSVASGIIAVVSLAANVGSGIKKLCDFWDSVQDSPKDVRTIVKQLNIISHIVDDIREGASAPQPYSRALSSTQAALDSCAESIQTLEEMVADSQSRLASRKKSRRTWAAIKFAWSGNKLKKYQHILDEMKSTLILATQHSNNQSQQQALATITQGVAVLLQQRSQDTTAEVSTDGRTIEEHLRALRVECRKTAAGIGNPLARFGFENMMDKALNQLSRGLDATSRLNGTIPVESYVDCDTAPKLPRSPSDSQYRRTQTYVSETSSYFGTLYIISKARLPAGLDESDDEVEDIFPEHFQTTTTFHPSQWLLRFGVSFGVQVLLAKSIEGSEYRMKSYRAVPDDALIFRFCREGNDMAIQKLFEHGQASPWDRDSWGMTPLFYAARYRNLATCNLLLTQGANIAARSNNGCISVVTCASSWPAELCTTKRDSLIDILRLCLHDLDVSDDWSFLGMLALSELSFHARSIHPSCPHDNEYPAAFKWAVPFLGDLLDLDCPTTMHGIARMISEIMHDSDTQLLRSIFGLIPDINSSQFSRYLSPVHQIFVGLPVFGIRASYRYLITRVVLNLHTVAAVESLYHEHWWWSGFRELDPLRGNTPTSLALRYSSSFSKLRRILREEGFDIGKFIEDELDTLLLAEQGWTRETLCFLFEVDFRPLEFSKCQSAYCQISVPPIDHEWLSALESLKLGNIQEAEDIFEARDRHLLNPPTPHGVVCQYCSPERKSKIELWDGQKFHDDVEHDNSPFLLSI